MVAHANALRTSRLAGMTRATSEKLKIAENPLIYAVDAPGVMVPFLGYDDYARERGIRLGMVCKSK